MNYKITSSIYSYPDDNPVLTIKINNEVATRFSIKSLAEKDHEWLRGLLESDIKYTYERGVTEGRKQIMQEFENREDHNYKPVRYAVLNRHGNKIYGPMSWHDATIIAKKYAHEAESFIKVVREEKS